MTTNVRDPRWKGSIMESSIAGAATPRAAAPSTLERWAPAAGSLFAALFVAAVIIGVAGLDAGDKLPEITEHFASEGLSVDAGLRLYPHPAQRGVLPVVPRRPHRDHAFAFAGNARVVGADRRRRLHSGPRRRRGRLARAAADHRSQRARGSRPEDGCNAVRRPRRDRRRPLWVSGDRRRAADERRGDDRISRRAAAAVVRCPRRGWCRYRRARIVDVRPADPARRPVGGRRLGETNDLLSSRRPQPASLTGVGGSALAADPRLPRAPARRRAVGRGLEVEVVRRRDARAWGGRRASAGAPSTAANRRTRQDHPERGLTELMDGSPALVRS